MLSLDPARLAEEVQRAEEFRRRHTVRSAAIAQRYMGNWYRDDYQNDATPENLVFSYIAFMLPSLCFNNPSVRITASQPITDGDVAHFMEAALRTWLEETEYVNEAQDVVRDALLGFGIMKVGAEPRDDPGAGRVRRAGLRPFAIRVPTHEFLIDPAAETPNDARFMGHSYWKDLDELKADPVRWDPAAVDKLGAEGNGGTDIDNLVEKPVRHGTTADRNQVNLVDLWIPESAQLVTMARTGNMATPIILRQTDYYGPADGPYQVFGFYRVPGDPYPMSPLQAVMEQFEELQLHAQASSREAESFKRFVLVEAGANDAEKAVMEARSGGVYQVKGLGKNVQQFELGGSPSGRAEYILQLRDRFDRTLGIGDAQRGVANGRTATENEIVQSNTDVRTDYLRGQMLHSVSRVLRKVAWYYFYDKSMVARVVDTDPVTGQQKQGVFLGGPQPGQEDMEWIDFKLKIEPTSMSQKDNGQLAANAQSLLQFVTTAAPMMMQMPQVNWRLITDRFGESIGEHDLSKVLFNPQWLQQMGQVPQAFGMGMGSQLPAGVDPALAALGQMMPPTPNPQTSAYPSGIGGSRPGFTQQAGGGPPLAPPGGGGPPMVFGGGGPRKMPPGPRTPQRGGGQPPPRRGFGPMPPGPRTPQPAAAAPGGQRSFPVGPRAKKKAAMAGAAK